MPSFRYPNLMQEKPYVFFRAFKKYSDRILFSPHTHNGIEIFMLINGDVKFIVEGYTYQLKPYDLMIFREDEIHQLYCDDEVYERIVIGISERFFAEQQCEFYKNIFLKRPVGCDNRIAADIVKSSGIYDAILRAERYIKDSESTSDTAVKCVLTELLYLINKINLSVSYPLFQAGSVHEIIRYVNQNITSPINLEEIANRFFISKPHLCRIFKAATGFTINKYITHKRMILVKQFVREGKNLSSACSEAGFGAYSNFYKIYVRDTGQSPRSGLQVLKP